jgi:hypothetical protein
LGSVAGEDEEEESGSAKAARFTSALDMSMIEPL